MNCDEARRRVTDCIDQGSDDAALDLHLIACLDCRVYADEIRLVVSSLDQLGKDTDGIAEFGTRREYPGERSRTRGRLHGSARPARIAAMIALFVAGSWLWVTRSPRQHPSEVTGVTDGPPSLSVETRLASTLDPRLGITLRGKSAANWLAVEREASDQNVHMYWLYPTVGQTGVSK